MTQPTMTDDAALLAELNDLLQLDHDAVSAYTIAIDGTTNDTWRQSLEQYRGDHQRHVDDLTRHIRSLGGVPVEMQHLPSGLFKAAVQAAGAGIGGDRETLLAFKSNEGQVRDKYERAARMARSKYPAEIATLLRRNANDEEEHYRWVESVLESMGAGANSRAGKAEAAFERVHGATATAMEGAERTAMRGAERLRKRFRTTSPTMKTVVGVGLAILVVRRILR